MPLSRVLALSFAAALGWGFWAFFTKLATRSLAPEVVMVISYTVGAAVGLGFVLTSDVTFALDGRGLALAGAAGLATGVGSVLYYVGLDTGQISLVSTVTALYFVVAVLLGVLVLRESLDLSDAAGIVLAVGAVALLAS